MNEFVKTKIAFTVALLAAIYTLNPLLLKFGDVGVTIFSFTLSIKIINFCILGCLGLSVYFYSIQFISEKRIKYIQEIGDILYGVALSLPPVFLVLVLSTKLIDLVGKEEFIKYSNAALTAIAGACLSKLTAEIKKKFSEKRRDSDAKGEEKLEHEYLSKAKGLFNDGYFDLAILETFKAVESALNKLLLSNGFDIERGKFFQNLKKAQRSEILTAPEINAIDTLRRLRNKIAHEDTVITEESATIHLREGEKIIISLSKSKYPKTGVNSFDWLMNNYENSIKSLKEKDIKQSKTVLEKVVDAWNKRDGGIGGEISIFFAQGLMYLPDLTIEFLQKVDHLDDWLTFTPRDILMDWQGNNSKELKKTQSKIIESLSSYINTMGQNKKVEIAKKVLDVFCKTEIGKIY